MLRRGFVLTVIYVYPTSDCAQNLRLRMHREGTIVEQTFYEILVNTCNAHMTEKRKSVVAHVVHP
jgi:hypothetical protein